MDCMKYEMNEWQKRMEWRARRFLGGWIAVMVGAVLCVDGMAAWGIGLLGIGAGMVWSAK